MTDHFQRPMLLFFLRTEELTVSFSIVWNRKPVTGFPCAASDANQLKRLVADNERISDHVQPVQTETYTNSGILNNAIAPYALSPLYIQPYLLQCRISECMYKYMVEKNIHHPGMDLILTQRAIGSFYVLFSFFRCIAFQFLCGASR